MNYVDGVDSAVCKDVFRPLDILCRIEREFLEIGEVDIDNAYIIARK